MFFEVLNAINDPTKQASIEQLDKVNNSVQQLATSQGLNANQMQSMMTALGGALHPILKQQQTKLGSNSFSNLLAQVTGSGNALALQSLIPNQIQQRLSQAMAQKTGMNTDMIQSMLPHLLPLVMGLFKMGDAKPGTTSSGNPLLSAFLDNNRDGNTDLGEVMKFAGRFLNVPG